MQKRVYRRVPNYALSMILQNGITHLITIFMLLNTECRNVYRHVPNHALSMILQNAVMTL